MHNPFKRYTNIFLSYSRSDRNAVIVLGTLILISIIVNVIVKNIEPKSDSDFSEIKEMLAEWEKAETQKIEIEQSVYFDFDPNTIPEKQLDSLSLPKYVKQNILKYRSTGAMFKTPADVQKIYGMNDSIFCLIKKYIKIRQEKQPVVLSEVNKKEIPLECFDPNTASIVKLKEYGFNTFQANNLDNYRKKGGTFKTPSELLKIYGIDSMFFFSIDKYIQINEIELPETLVEEENIMIELNTADSADLVRLVGIGATYASRIIKYRNLLGGFYAKEQLTEVYNFPEETYNNIQKCISVDTLKISKLRLNFFEFAELLKHPYLNKLQVKVLLNRREREGVYRNIAEIKSLEGFDSETVKKLRPYLTCR